jgi:FixJ family two-component response regulator
VATISNLIAIVDDDLYVLKALARLLSAHRLSAKTFSSAREFLASLPEGLPECLVTDLHIPDMTGLELQQHLRRHGIQIPTIIITAHDNIAMRERCKAAGAVAFLSKPVQEASLLAAIGDARHTAKDAKPL